MIGKDVLEETISNLEKAADIIDADTTLLLQNTEILARYDQSTHSYSHHWDPNHDKILQRRAMRGYQNWYNAAYQLIKEFLPAEKEKEFVENYGSSNPFGVLRYIQLTCSTLDGNKPKIIDRFNTYFELQRSILSSIPSVAEVKELNLRKIIASDFIDSELDKAEYLLRSGFARCAGVLAGVALERYLKALCDTKKLEYEYDDTIEPLSQKLYEADKIDVTELKLFQHLGSIRNDCAHQNEGVLEDDLKGRAKELIERVKRLTL
jgi:HEPN domain-containing protein